MKPSVLIDSGLALVPVPVGKKGPLVKGWNLRENVVTTVEELHKLKNKNIGLAHAYCTPSVTCAIDIDNYKEARKWLLAQHVDLKALLLGKEAVVIWSGKKNSLKLLYHLPMTKGALPSKQIKSEDHSMMLEFRCASESGKTVQDLIPGSQHSSGSTYAWMGEGDPLNIPPIPDRLLVLWLDLIEDGNNKDSAKAYTQCLESPRQVARVKELLSYIEADCDYFRWRDIVWAVLSTSWQSAPELVRQWSMSAPERYDEGSFAVLLNSYNPDIEGGLSLGTVYHHARLGGFNE
jgi:hypothetical protein